MLLLYKLVDERKGIVVHYLHRNGKKLALPEISVKLNVGAFGNIVIRPDFFIFNIFIQVLRIRSRRGEKNTPYGTADRIGEKETGDRRILRTGRFNMYQPVREKYAPFHNGMEIIDIIVNRIKHKPVGQKDEAFVRLPYKIVVVKDIDIQKLHSDRALPKAVIKRKLVPPGKAKKHLPPVIHQAINFRDVFLNEDCVFC